MQAAPRYRWRLHERKNKGSTSKIEPMIDIAVNGTNLPRSLLTVTPDFSERWCTILAPFPNYYEQIYNFEVRDDDVFIVTFPKSGTTWTQEAVWLLMNNLNYEAARSELLKRRSIYIDLNGIYPEYLPDSLELANQCRSPRLLKSHLPAHMLPQQVWQRKNKIIFCVRNVKDVVVSYFHFQRGVGTWLGEDMDTFVRDFICGDLMYTPYWESILDYWQLSQQESHICLLTYERMKTDLAGVLSDLCKFLERPALTELELEKLVQHLSFENMKSNEYINPLTARTIRTDIMLPQYEFIRRGIVGSYKDELSVENQKLLDDWSEKFLKERKIKLSDIWGAL